jgi:hypothetical protein
MVIYGGDLRIKLELLATWRSMMFTLPGDWVQFIFVVPHLNMVVVSTADNKGAGERYFLICCGTIFSLRC